MVMVNDVDVPDHEPVRDRRWRRLGGHILVNPPVAGLPGFESDCAHLNAGDLSLAFLRPDGLIQATYCDRNGLASRTYEGPV